MKKIIVLLFALSAQLAFGMEPQVDPATLNADLTKAVLDGSLSRAKELIARGADMNAVLYEGLPALIGASIEGQVEVVRLLLDLGANVNDADKMSWTAFVGASIEGQVEVARLLLDRGVNVNAADKSGLTALMGAARRGHVEMVRLLLDRGANVNAATKDGNTVLQMAGNTALQIASSAGHLEVVRLLLDRKADVNETNDIRWSALMMASMRGYLEVVRLLLDRGADVNETDWAGSSALILASSAGHLEVVRLLLDHGANVNAIRENGWSALMVASRSYRPGLVTLLLESGANMYTVNKDGMTVSVLRSACAQGDINAIAELLTFIPLDKHQEMRANIRGLIGVRYAQPKLPIEMSNLIGQKVIDPIVQEQMPYVMKRARALIAESTRADGQTLQTFVLQKRDEALAKNNPESAKKLQAIADLLDLDNPESQAMLRRHVEINIKRIMGTSPEHVVRPRPWLFQRVWRAVKEKAQSYWK
jgi:ankyrin repeat protein